MLSAAFTIGALKVKPYQYCSQQINVWNVA